MTNETKELSERLGPVLEAAQKGDEAALGQLIEATQDRLFRFCFYLGGNRQLAQDLCQDTYIKVLEEMGTIRDATALMSWLFRVAKNLFLDHVKSAAYRSERESIDDATDLVLQMDEPQKEVVLQIRQVVADLEPEARSALLLVDLEGYSYREAANIIGISEDALRSRLHRARQLFVNKIEKEEPKKKETKQPSNSSSDQRRTQP